MVTYRDAGVDIDAGDELVHRIKPLVRKTFTPDVVTDIGGFGGLFDISRLKNYANPILVSSVDGVGTKLKVAFLADRHDTVGEDLVNHCVNDIAVCGAVPLFFLDYFSVGKLNPEVAEKVMEGFSRGCVANRCALIGGETAEMPDIYQEGEYDLAGTIVGVVERERMINGSLIQEGDTLLGIASNGLHTNGYSLARKVLFARYGIHDKPAVLGGESVAEALLRVHLSYLSVIHKLADRQLTNGFAHITGGGLIGNLARIVPDGMSPEIDWTNWTVPPLFSLIQEAGDVPTHDMRRTFNMGVGLVAVVSPDRVDRALATISEEKLHGWVVGSIRRD